MELNEDSMTKLISVSGARQAPMELDSLGAKQQKPLVAT